MFNDSLLKWLWFSRVKVSRALYLFSGAGHTFDPLLATVRDCTVGVSDDSAHRIDFASPLGEHMAAASWLGKFALCLAAVLALPLSSAHSERDQ